MNGLSLYFPPHCSKASSQKVNSASDGARAVPAAAAAAAAESSLVRDSVSFIAHNDHSYNNVDSDL